MSKIKSKSSREGLSCFRKLVAGGQAPPKDYHCFDCGTALDPPAPYFAKLDVGKVECFYPICAKCAEPES